MKRPSARSKPTHAGWRVLMLITLLVTSFATNFALPPSASASVQDAFASAYSLDASLATSPSTFSDPAIDITSYSRDSEEVDGISGCSGYPSSLATNSYSVWYSYTPASNGWLTLSTLGTGTNYDTVIEVWAGSLAAANSVGCNDDGASSRQSEVTLPVIGATHYIIQIRRYDATTMPATPMLGFDASFSTIREFYVNQTTGSDNNTGTLNLPFRSIGKAENSLPPAGGTIHIVDPGIYNETVTASVPTIFVIPAGAVSVPSLKLMTGPVTASGAGTFNASAVTVQPPGLIQNGVDLVSTGGTITTNNGTFAENVTIAKSLTLRVGNEGFASIQPASGDAVTITGGSVTLRGFGITAAGGTGVNITGGTGHTLVHNNITGNTSGVVNTTGSSVIGVQNYWGTTSGPTNASNPSGTGNTVSADVTYRQWCTNPVPTCGPLAGNATKLAFNPSPSDSLSGVAFPTQPVVEAQDDFGNLDPSYSVAATLAIGTNPGTGTLAGTLTASFVNGKATFSGLSINNPGVGYTLVASSGTLTGTTSTPFTITNAATDLVFSVSPNTSRAGTAFGNQPVVIAHDAFGNVATGFSGSVTLSIKPSTGTPGATLGGTLTVNAVAGVATFSGLNIDTVGTDYQLTASSAGLTSADSTAFNITATGLSFTVEPITTLVGQTLNVKVEAQDIANATDTTFNGPVTLTLKTSAGPTTTPLFGTLVITAVNGVADFSAAGLNITKAGTGYILSASTTDLPGADSVAFDITSGPPTHMLFTTTPANTMAGAPLQVTVEARDAFENLATTYTSTLDLSIVTNPGGGTLGGTTSTAFSGGVASFARTAGLNINKVGVGYVLRASSGALPAIDTRAFNITASRLVFSVSPSNSQVGWAFPRQPVVRAEDDFGTVDTTFTNTVTLTIASGTGANGATLKGTTALAATDGVATFDRLVIDRVGTNYQLNAATPLLPSVASAAFTVTRAIVFTPMIMQPAHADLVGSFTINTNPIVAFNRAVVTVTITNKGEAPAEAFWVDFYINPSTPPTAANERWDQSCGAKPCEFGLAWYVPQALAPGQSITLTSMPGSFNVENTRWKGYFTSNNLNLYLYVDSWNPGVTSGAVFETNEKNNSAEFHTQAALAGVAEIAPQQRDADIPALPERPARPTN